MATSSPPVMCIGLGCPIRERCWRCRGVPLDEWTTWFEQLPYDFMNHCCQQFVSIEREAASVGDLVPHH